MKFVDFEPDETNVPTEDIPFLEDVSKLSGWAGHTTEVPEKTLIAQIHNEIGFMNGHVISTTKGTFTDNYGPRTGYIFKVIIILPDGRQLPAKIEVVALPVHNPTPQKRDQALRTALFNLRDTLASSRRMEKLVPGYRAIIGFLQQDESGPTLSQSWLMSVDKSLPRPKDDKNDMIDAEEINDEKAD